MGYSNKVIADSTTVTPVGVVGNGFNSIGTIRCEDATHPVHIRFSAIGAPTVAQVRATGSLVTATSAPFPIQDVNSGIDSSQYYVTAIPVPATVGASIPIRSYVALPDNSAHAFVTTAATIPAVNATVTLEVTSSAPFTQSNYDTGRGDLTAGIFVATMGFCDVTAVPDATHVTVKFLALPGAAVSIT